MSIPVLVAIAIVILAGLMTVLVARLQQKSRSRKFQVELRNLGNVQSRYELQAKDPDGALKFQFTLDGDELPWISDELKSDHQQQVTRTAPPHYPPPADAAVQGNPAQANAKLGKLGDQALEGGGIIAGMLSTLGLLLPWSLGAPLTRAASQMQRGQITASRVKQLKGQSKKLKPKASPGRSGSAASPAAKSAVGSAGGDITEPRTEGELVESFWVQTPSIQPGEQMTAQLHIRPIRSSLRPWAALAQAQSFTVFSRAAGMHDLVAQVPVVTTEASVRFSQSSAPLRLLPYLVILAVTLGLLALTFLVGGVG
jgi:hypothetical protein